MNYVYIVECKDGTLYTGWTNNLSNRLKCHNTGIGAKYTRHRFPVVLKYFECFEDKTDACRKEFYIKQLSRCEKIKLIETFTENKDFSKQLCEFITSKK